MQFPRLTTGMVCVPLLAAVLGGTACGGEFLSWPKVGSEGEFRLAPMTEKRVGFSLGLAARGRRVVVAISAFMEAKTAAGYDISSLALDVNGEVMGLNIGDRPRLLNRPMTMRFGPKAAQVAGGRPGTLGLIENWGSARWALPRCPSIKTWLASPGYKPVGLEDPAWIVLEITDLVHENAYNVLRVKHEGRKGTLRCVAVSVHYEPSEADAIQAVYERLYEQCFGRAAVKREPTTGREWAYDMDLIDNSHGAAGSMAEIENLQDARRIIAPLKQQGYSAVMVSGLHMRYTYTDLWESRIVPYMKHICAAAHEAEMKVIDHYDVPIFFSRGYPFLLRDDHLEWTQRDIRYGTPTRMYCINNPHFRKHFFDFARRVQRQSGIDAYQIDEVNFFEKSFCGCVHCRRLFEEDTGFELPYEADSPVFFNDAAPLWRLFQLWRTVSIQKFRLDFLAAVRKENPAAFLSVYTTTHYSPQRRGGAWGSFLVSYANGKEGVTRLPFHDHRYGLADFKITTGLADALDHSTWMLWYPLTSSAARFCWGMSEASGCAQWHSKKWSGAVRELIRWPHRMKKFDFTTFADVAMVFSEKSKDASLWTGYYHGMETLGWGEAMVEHNIQYHNIHEVAVTPELLSHYKVVILPQMTVIDKPCRRAFETYVRNGGTLIVTGETGMLDGRGRPRPDFLLGEMMNLRFIDILNAPFEVMEAGFTFGPDSMLYKYGARMLYVAPRDPKRSRVLMRYRRDGKTHPGVVQSGYGKGKVYTIATFFGLSNFQTGLQEGSKQIFKTNPNSAPFMARLIRDILADGETIIAADLPPGIVYTAWIKKRDRSEINIHLLNVQDHKPLAYNQSRHRREITFPLVKAETTLLLRRVRTSRAIFHSPDPPASVECGIERTREGARITIPGGKMTMYGLLKVHDVQMGDE